jgi:hypothetical protein
MKIKLRPDLVIEGVYYDPESLAFTLSKELCGQYMWCTEPWRDRSRKLLEALMEYFDYDPDIAAEVVEMYEVTLEDVRLGRHEAEIENLHRDVQARRQAETTS